MYEHILAPLKAKIVDPFPVEKEIHPRITIHHKQSILPLEAKSCISGPFGFTPTSQVKMLPSQKMSSIH